MTVEKGIKEAPASSDPGCYDSAGSQPYGAVSRPRLQVLGDGALLVGGGGAVVGAMRAVFQPSASMVSVVLAPRAVGSEASQARR